MLEVTIDKLLAKYTAPVEPVKVWKVTTENGNCRNCIFRQRLSHGANPDGVGYNCNKRNLTSNGYKLDELFIAVNFDSWRCETDTRFSYKPGKLKVKRYKKQPKRPAVKKADGITPLQAARKRNQNQNIMDMYTAGMDVAEIADKLNMTRKKVYTAICDNGGYPGLTALCCSVYQRKGYNQKKLKDGTIARYPVHAWLVQINFIDNGVSYVKRIQFKTEDDARFFAEKIKQNQL